MLRVDICAWFTAAQVNANRLFTYFFPLIFHNLFAALRYGYQCILQEAKYAFLIFCHYRGHASFVNHCITMKIGKHTIGYVFIFGARMAMNDCDMNFVPHILQDVTLWLKSEIWVLE